MLKVTGKGSITTCDGISRRDFLQVGVLGAGMMGAGIAYAQAARGIATVLRDVSIDKAEHGKAYSAKLTQARVDKGRMSPHDQAELLKASGMFGTQPDVPPDAGLQTRLLALLGRQA